VATRIAGVYAIKNMVSGRHYVGSSVDIDKRWKCHIKGLGDGIHHSWSLQRAWVKPGATFEFRVLEIVNVLFLTCKQRKLLLLTREQYWIDQLHAGCPHRGYNMHPVAGRPLGHKWSVEARMAQSARMLGRKLGKYPASHGASVSARRTGIKASAETRAKMSAVRMGRKLSEETRAKISAAKMGRKRSPETCAKMSIARIGFKHSEEALAKMSAVHNGRKKSAEHRVKISDALKARSIRLKAGMANVPL
jgi:group I intron endonuclease